MSGIASTLSGARGGLERLSVLDSYYAAHSDVLEHVAVTDADGKLRFQSPRDAKLEAGRPDRNPHDNSMKQSPARKTAPPAIL